MSGEKETDKTNGGLTPDSSSEQIDSSVSRRGLLAGLSAGIDDTVERVADE